MVLKNRPCPICSSEEKHLLFKQNFFDNEEISLISHYDVVVCDHCGFVFADQIPSQDEFDKYYAAMSKYEFNYLDGQTPLRYKNHFSEIVDFIQPHLPAGEARILDIGCSAGGLLSVFKSRGYSDLLGIDPSPSCAMATKKLYGIDAEVKDIATFQSHEPFDLVILSEVLEHIVDFDSAMNKIRSLIKDSGYLLLEVPDAERFGSDVKAPFQQFSMEHINFFSQYSLRNFLSKYSFQEIDVQSSEIKVGDSAEPVILILAKKMEKQNTLCPKDTTSEQRILEYIQVCSGIDSNLKRVIANKLAHRDKLIVWGAGAHTQRLMGSGLDSSRILYIVDSNERLAGKHLGGIEIRSPQDIREGNIPILISTYAYEKEITSQIKEELKLDNEIITIYHD